MRGQLLSLAFGLTLLAPSVGISCDDAKSADTKEPAQSADRVLRRANRQRQKLKQKKTTPKRTKTTPNMSFSGICRIRGSKRFWQVRL